MRVASSRAPSPRFLYTSRVKLTVTVITHNESRNIAAALDSVSWADEIVVVDSGSTDDTVEIAKRLATRVEVRDWPGYGTQKNYAASLASNDWILSLDADERVTPALAQEIRGVLSGGPPILAIGFRESRSIWDAGSGGPTGIPTPSFVCTIGAPGAGTSVACTSPLP